MPEHPSRRSLSRRCPQCSQPLMRVMRSADDKQRHDANAYRRYRCRSAGCDWQGLLAVTRRRRTRGATAPAAAPSPAPARMAHAGRMGRIGAWLLLAGGVAWGSWAALQAMMAG